MNWYQLMKVLHFLGLIALFGFFVLASRAGARLRASTTTSDARTWLGLLEVARPMLPSGVIMLTVSGAVMTGISWRAAYPFVVVGLVASLSIWAAWAVVGARFLRDVREALGDGEALVSPSVARLIHEPRSWGAIGALNGAAMGVLVIMTLKPQWIGSIAIVVALSALLGGAFVRTVSRQRAVR